MKVFVIVMCVGMGIAIVWANREEIKAFASPRIQYVERERGGVGGGPEAYLAQATDASDWERRYLFLRYNGMIKSGVPDVDEAVSSSVHLRDQPGRWYPERWRERLTAGDKWIRDKRTNEPDEEFIDASDDTPPAWVGKPLGRNAKARKQVSTGKALSRFFFGVEEDERL